MFSKIMWYHAFLCFVCLGSPFVAGSRQGRELEETGQCAPIPPLVDPCQASECEAQETVHFAGVQPATRVKPLLAIQHGPCGKHGQRKGIVVLRRKCHASRYILDLPVPIVLDTRPWRCLACGLYFPVKINDIQNRFPGTLVAKCAKQAHVFFTKRFLQLIIGKFGETFNAAAVKRFILDLYLANTIYINHAERALWAIDSIPRLSSLRFMLREALLSYLPGLIRHIEEHVHVYSGSAIRGDGHYKVAARIRVADGTPPSVIYAWCGVDGALLRPPAALASETWPVLKEDLAKLIPDLARNRKRAGLPGQAVYPAFHATDTYGKHRLKLQSFYTSLAEPQLSVSAKTPQAEAQSAEPAEKYCPTLQLAHN